MLCTRAVICDLMFTSYCCPFSISTSLFLMDYQYRNFVPDSKILRFRVMPYWGTGHLWLPDIILHDRKRPQDRSNLSAYALRDRTALEGNSWPLSRWLSLTHKDWVLRWSKNWKSKKLKKWNWSKNWRSKNWRSLFSIKVNKFYSWRNVWDTEKVHWCLRVQVLHSKTETSSFPTVWGDSTRKSAGMAEPCDIWSRMTSLNKESAFFLKRLRVLPARPQEETK